MGAMQRRKGAAGEREAAAALAAIGIAARRLGQTCGALDGADIETALPALWFEVKRTERLNLGAAMEQARFDAGVTRTPVVLHRGNRRPWMLTLRLNDLPRVTAIIAQALGATIPT